MGSFDTYCIVCGGPFLRQKVATNIGKCLPKNYYKLIPYLYWSDPTEDIITEFYKKHIISKECFNASMKHLRELSSHRWLENVVAILPKKIIKVEFDDGDRFQAGKKVISTSFNKDQYGVDEIGAICMHKSCLALLKKNNYDTSYESLKDGFKVKSKKKKYINTNTYSINYGKIVRYQSQFFCYFLAYLENGFMLLDPLKNKNNATRILKLPLPIRKIGGKGKLVKGRMGPSESATKFKPGTKKKGNDGNMWIIVKNKNGVHQWRKFKIHGGGRQCPKLPSSQFNLGTRRKGLDGNFWKVAKIGSRKRWQRIN